jgi:arginase family enzyme
MPLRMLLDEGTVRVEDVALVGARSLDPPEEDYIALTRLPVGETGVDRALEGVDAVYVAFDVDVLDPGEDAAPFMPDPGGMTLAGADALLRRIATVAPVAGAGFTGLAPDERNVAAVERLCRALGL